MPTFDGARRNGQPSPSLHQCALTRRAAGQASWGKAQPSGCVIANAVIRHSGHLWRLVAYSVRMVEQGRLARTESVVWRLQVDPLRQRQRILIVDADVVHRAVHIRASVAVGRPGGSLSACRFAPRSFDAKTACRWRLAPGEEVVLRWTTARMRRKPPIPSKSLLPKA
jgi:hypothetical protein